MSQDSISLSFEETNPHFSLSSHIFLQILLYFQLSQMLPPPRVFPPGVLETMMLKKSSQRYPLDALNTTDEWASDVLGSQRCYETSLHPRCYFHYQNCAWREAWTPAFHTPKHDNSLGVFRLLSSQFWARLRRKLAWYSNVCNNVPIIRLDFAKWLQTLATSLGGLNCRISYRPGTLE